MDIIKQAADIIKATSKDHCCLFTEEGWQCSNEGKWRTFDERFGLWKGAQSCICDSHWAYFVLLMEDPCAAEQLNKPRIPWEERLKQEYGEE